MAHDQDGASVVRRWQLASSLKDLRERAGLTQDEAVAKLRKGTGRWSAAKLSRIENRVQSVKPRDVEQLLDAYGLADPDSRYALVKMAAESKEQGWWIRLGRLPDDIKPLLSLESDLVQLRDFQNQLVPGLLQTPDYARAVMTAVNPGHYSPEELEQRVAARMIRQHVLHKAPPPRLHLIIDQTVLERTVGRPSVMRDQLRKLLDTTDDPNITIQVLPLDVGGSPGLEGPFSILTLPEPVPDIGYVEGMAGMVYLENREHVRDCTLRFGILTKLALPRAESMDVIAEILKSYE